MRIDSLPVPASERAATRTSAPEQNSFGQTMLQLERGMWPGARAGASAVEAMPRQGVSGARSGGAADKHADVPSMLPDDAAAMESIAAQADAAEVHFSHAAMPVWIAPDETVSTQAQPANACLAPLRGNRSATPAEFDAASTNALGQARARPEAASTDHVTVAEGPSGTVIVLRFDAPLAQRKALFDAVAAELGRRGYAGRPITINGTPCTAGIRGKP